MRRLVLMMVAVGVTTISLAWYSPARAANEATEVAEHLIELVKIGRVVVSEHQDTINDATKAEKGFTADFVADEVMERFKKKTKIDLRIPNVVPQANFYLALVDAEREVVDEAQPVINRPGVGFKGFLHAVFARRVGEHFYKKTGVRMKLTGIDYRSPSSKPDDFEQEVLRMFSDPRHPKDQVYVAQHNGRRKVGVAYDGSRICSCLLPELPRCTKGRAGHYGDEEGRMERRRFGRGGQPGSSAEVIRRGSFKDHLRIRIHRTLRRFSMSKIVVVDDSYAELQLIEGCLKGANHTVISYPNSDKLEDKMAIEKPDLIVLDVVMPGRNGFQACRDLKNDDRCKNIPILLCTSKGNESDKFWGQQQGANGYIVKPFKAEDLLNAVKKVMG